MPLIILKQVTHWQLDYNDVNALILEHFSPFVPDDYNCVAEQEWSNDTCQEFDLSLQEYLPSEIENIEQLVAGTMPYDHYDHDTCMLLHELVRRGVLPEGKYLITVCW